MRRVFGLRFAVEAAAIVAVAFVVWYERLSHVAIVAAMAGTWLVVAVVEWALGRRAEAVEDEAPEYEPEAEPEHELALADGASEAELEPEPVAEPVVALPPWQMQPREWNIWDLERIAREGAGADSERDEELSFLLMYLRDFAGPDGMLPAHFDGLVRDSFGDLLAGSRR